jgi:hypothetical protein
MGRGAGPAAAPGGGRVAGEDQHLGVLRQEPVDAGQREVPNLIGRARAVRGSRVVAEVDRGLAGETALDLGQDGQAADSGVEDGDRTLVGRDHGVQVR